ncbi:sulfurtransferase TusA [Marinobacter halophilus]|uniref:Sulfur carrier protein TusA n=1 Tax=Marinobacter halophilus TaxID=1323740 RepID=A0A2T1K9A3_9GAMM|nr:sulfurtransferase TusA [Marinobacter halophilus]PSF06598.1 sulfurtransferase TusA [Marinobacter halophilus]GGC73985.1 sulfurtransferase TusA [Marinobacter halophilus]
MTALDFNAELDTRGLFCPEPVMMLHNRIHDVQVGEVLRVIATDPSTTRDIPRFCQFLGHELLSQQELDGEYHYLIRRCES